MVNIQFEIECDLCHKKFTNERNNSKVIPDLEFLALMFDAVFQMARSDDWHIYKFTGDCCYHMYCSECKNIYKQRQEQLERLDEVIEDTRESMKLMSDSSVWEISLRSLLRHREELVKEMEQYKPD